MQISGFEHVLRASRIRGKGEGGEGRKRQVTVPKLVHKLGSAFLFHSQQLKFSLSSPAPKEQKPEEPTRPQKGREGKDKF